jgi:hypothetical protein
MRSVPNPARRAKIKKMPAVKIAEYFQSPNCHKENKNINRKITPTTILLLSLEAAPVVSDIRSTRKGDISQMLINGSKANRTDMMSPSTMPIKMMAGE